MENMINNDVWLFSATNQETPYEQNQWKVPAILLFYKKINSATWKEQKN